jgi:hypothetical protein
MLPILRQSRLDAWFWLHVAQAILFTALAILAFTRLAKVAGRVHADD